MKQQERKERTKEKILQAARDAFSALEYETVTMDGICSRYGISKGSLYHYYSGKDALFLACLKEVFEQLESCARCALEELEYKDGMTGIKTYFQLRNQFFQEHPREKNIYENAVLRTPKALAEEIECLRRPLGQLNQKFFLQVIQKIGMRDELDAEQVLPYLRSMEPIFWQMVKQYQMQKQEADAYSFMEASEDVFKMILFGIVKGGNQ